MIRLATVLIAALLVAVPSEGMAQIRQGDPDRAELVRRIQRGFEDRIARELGIDQEQRVALRGVFQEFGADRGELASRRRALGQEIYQFVTGDEDESDRADEIALDLMSRTAELRSEEEALMRAEEERILTILSPVQVIHLQFLREQFGEQIRRLGPEPPFGR